MIACSGCQSGPYAERGTIFGGLAGMAGRTNMVVGYWKDQFTLVPIPLAVSERKHIDPESWLWSIVLSCTGQPKEMI